MFLRAVLLMERDCLSENALLLIEMCTRCASNAKDDVPADNFAAIIFVSIMSFCQQ